MDDCQLITTTCRRRLPSSKVATCDVPRTRTSLGDRSFTAAGPRLWNNLPVHLRDSELAFLEFCQLLKTAAPPSDWFLVFSALYKCTYLHTYLNLALYCLPCICRWTVECLSFHCVLLLLYLVLALLPVQWIVWKDAPLKVPVMCWVRCKTLCIRHIHTHVHYSYRWCGGSTVQHDSADPRPAGGWRCEAYV